ncbi:MAG TPA: DUF4232 domain-containing protein [Streptosporangiaceae bacterium]|nr:DUF4232 domain-containing protein [Streptosporangiaceae bacterium]
MNYLSTTARRLAAVAAAVAAAGLIAATAAFATTFPGTTGDAGASVPGCTAFGLGVWVAINQGNGAAGTIYYPLEFTNLSGHTCSLFGFPGVSALNAQGRQLGSPAGWDRTTTPHTVILKPGATAHTILAYHDAAVTTEPGCDPVNTAVLLRVYPPGRHSATDAAYDFQSCSHTGPVYLSISGPIVPGVGTING